METPRIDKARDAFVMRYEKPTYKELSVEFGVPVGTVGGVAADQGWTAMRAAYLDDQLAKADASSILLRAVQTDRRIVHAYADLALVTIARIKTAIESVPEDRAAQTKLDAYNTGMFAALNLAKSLHEVGIVGISKTLDGEGKEGNGRWDPKMLQQINVQVTAIAQQAGAVKPAEPAKVAPVVEPSAEPVAR